MLCLSRLQVLKKQKQKNSQIYLQFKTVFYSFHVQVAHSRKSFPSRLLFYCCSWNVKPCWISFWLFLNFIPRNVGNATKPGLVKRSQTGIKRVVRLLESGVCLVWSALLEEHGHKSSPPSWIHHEFSDLRLPAVLFPYQAVIQPGTVESILTGCITAWYGNSTDTTNTTNKTRKLLNYLNNHYYYIISHVAKI